MFLIFAVKSTFFSKNAKTKCGMNKYLIRIERKRSHSYRVSCCIKKGSPLPCLQTFSFDVMKTKQSCEKVEIKLLVHKAFGPDLQNLTSKSVLKNILGI
jgi:hypothetical protein